MNTKNVLVLSLTVNVALCVTLLWLWEKQGPPYPSGSDLDAQHVSGVAARPLSERPSFRELLELGLSDKQAKQLRLQTLKDEYIASIPPPADEYWKSDLLDGIGRYMLAESAAHRKISEELVTEFGPTVETDPVFREEFQPLAIQHPYLSSSDQIALKQFQLERQAEFMSLSRSGLSPPFPGPGAPSGMVALPARPQGVESVLAGDALLNYNLRNSPIASTLRALDAAMTQDQFVETYKLLDSAFGPARAIPVNVTPIRERLIESLGESGSAKVLAAFDNNFAALRTAGGGLGLTQHQIYATHDIFLDADKKILEAYRVRERDVAGSTTMVQSAMQERSRQLTDLLGSELAEAMLKARSQTSARPASSHLSVAGAQ